MLNRQEILHALRKYAPISRADLAKKTQLSRPCVSALVDEMIQEGLIHEIGIGDSTVGRKPILLEYNATAYLVMGALFDGNVLHMALADLKGELLCHEKKKLVSPISGETLIQELEEGLSRLLEQSQMTKEKMLGIGIGLPGITRKRDGTISYSPSTGWMDLPVQTDFEARLGLPVVIDNDVNMMTLGEYYKGIGIGVANQIYMYVGTGIGAGIILHHQFYRGSREAAGEIGYMIVGAIQPISKGEYGIFERNYSTPAIYAKARKILPHVCEETSVIRQLVHHAEQGNVQARHLLDEVYQHWAYGMVNMISLLDPDLLILSGEMVNIGEKGVQRIQHFLAEWVPMVPDLKLAALGEQAGMIGAVFSVLETFPMLTGQK